MLVKFFVLCLIGFFDWSQISQGTQKDAHWKKGIRDILKAFSVDHKSRHKRSDSCQDKLADCDSYKNYCTDPTYHDYLQVNCKKTCNFCVSCSDKVPYCAHIKNRCSDPLILESMKFYCAKTCGVCTVAPTTLPPTTIPRTELPIDQGSVECGTRAVHTRIVGGTNARPGMWPWQVTMDYTGESGPHWCGGSIVTPEWIVTAAHCFAYGDDITKYTITAGEHDLNQLEGYEQNITIERIFIHPQYDAYKNHDYDVALMKLKTPIRYNTRVRPVCLAQSDFAVGTSCYVTGWGHTAESGSIARILQQAQVPLVSRDTCQQGYNDLGYTITTRMRCAGYAGGQIDACQGDSGGPLVCVRNDKWYLMGIVSWGIGCARRGRYGVYADVMDVKYWVQKTITDN